jgi:hypothetical protein
MWSDLANSLNNVPTSSKRNYLYDCLNTSYYLAKALNELDDYLNNFMCPKKSMEFYTNNIFINSLGYYSENQALSSVEKKNIENLKNLGFAYHKLDNLLCKNSISPEEARVKMKAILKTMAKGMDFVLTAEIERWGLMDKIIFVSDKKAYISNLIDDKKDSKIEYMLNFLTNKIN